MSEPLFVWSTNHAKDPNACQYYRIAIPLEYIEKLGFGYGYEDRGNNKENDLKAMLTSDICQFYSIGGEAALHQAQTINEMKPAMRIDGVNQFPPLVVYDLDDNTDFVHPMNFTFAYLGVRAYPGVDFLKPPYKVGTLEEVRETLEWEDYKGNRSILWEDLVTQSSGYTFDVARNLKQMKVRHELIRSCAGATASTPELASYFKDVIKQKTVYVFPNTVVLDDYEFYNVERKDPDKIRILWQGSMSHYVDWYPLRGAVAEISKRYPNVKWVIYGEWFDWVHDMIPDEMVEHHPWSHFQSFKLKRGLLNIDINLCPLANNPFNRCKSAIKWYEGSIWNNPEATLAANVGPYKREIENGKTGLLYNTPEEFVEKLSVLIENVELRKSIASEAKKWVLNNRVPEKTIPGLVDFYTELKNIQRRKFEPRVIVSSNSDIKKFTGKLLKT